MTRIAEGLAINDQIEAEGARVAAEAAAALEAERIERVSADRELDRRLTVVEEAHAQPTLVTPPLRTALGPLQPAAAQARTPRGTKVPCPPAPLRVQCPPTPPLPGSPLIPRRLPIAMELEAEMAQLTDSVDRLSGGIASGLMLSAAALLQLKCVMESMMEMVKLLCERDAYLLQLLGSLAVAVWSLQQVGMGGPCVEAMD